MSAPYSTLELTTAWDLALTSSGNLSVLAPMQSLTQDVASACMTFSGEVYYDTSLGVPYSQQILGFSPPLQLLISQLETAALTVPYVATATVVISADDDRRVTGQIQFTDMSGATQVVQV